MSLMRTLLQAVQSWRLRRIGAKKAARRAAVSMEQLDHRQLLAVNFTGVVATDFPVTTSPGVVTVIPGSNAHQASFANAPFGLQNIAFSGFQVQDIRVTYTAADDTLSIGLETPADPLTPGHQVIAGDADGNGNSGVTGSESAPPSVSPAVQAATGGQFKDFQDLGGSEYMGAFLDLTGTGTPDIVAGIAQAGTSKLYQVAQSVNGTTQFGAAFPQFTGRLYLNNDVNHPNMEFSIVNFSQLYQQVTGKAITPDTQIGVGAFGGSQDDFASETFIPPQDFRFGNATIPVTPPPPTPPLTPPVLVNFHSNNHINTAHAGLVRVNIFGTGTFDVNQIVPSSVRVGGAAPIANFVRRIPGYPFLERTFVFRGTDITLPAGVTAVDVTGQLVNGQKFDSVYQVFNRNDSFYLPGAITARNGRLAAHGLPIPGGSTTAAEAAAPAPAPLKVDYGTGAATSSPAGTGTVVAPAATPRPVQAQAQVKPRATKARLGTRVADLRKSEAKAAPAPAATSSFGAAFGAA